MPSKSGASHLLFSSKNEASWWIRWVIKWSTNTKWKRLTSFSLSGIEGSKTDSSAKIVSILPTDTTSIEFCLTYSLLGLAFSKKNRNNMLKKSSKMWWFIELATFSRNLLSFQWVKLMTRVLSVSLMLVRSWSSMSFSSWRQTMSVLENSK